MEALWPNIFVTDDNITQCVRDVRRALGHQSHRMLRTVRRRGYIFEAAAVRRDFAPTGDVAAYVPDSAVAIRARTERPVRLSVLVLQLRNHEGSDAYERLAESLTDRIVTDLASYLNNLTAGEAQVLFHDDRLAHWRTTPRDCQGEYLLRGSVEGRPRMSLSLQLIDSARGVCIWTERRELDGRRGLVAQLVHAISIALVRDVGRRIEALPTQGLTLRDVLMQGHAWLLRPTSPFNGRRALSCFEQALAMDPDSMGARLGIASALVSSLTAGWSQKIAEDEARAEAMLLDIFEVGTDMARAHAVNGTLRRLQGRSEASRVELEIATNLAPNYAMASSQLGMTLVYCGQPEAALPYFEKAVRTAPHDPQAPLLLSNLGMCLVMLADLDTAVDRLRQAAAGNPQHSAPPLLLAAALGLRSKSAEARVAARRAVELCPTLGTLSSLRDWVKRQAGPAFMPIYEHTVERGLQQAGMTED